MKTTAAYAIIITEKSSDTPDAENGLKVPCFRLPRSGQCPYLMDPIFGKESASLGNITVRQLAINHMKNFMVIHIL